MYSLLCTQLRCMTCTCNEDYCACSRARYSRHLSEPTTISLTGKHNHPLNSADVLRRRDVSTQVTEKFLQLFSAGYSPSTALETHKCDLQLEDQENYAVCAADRHLCPDLQWCFRLYYKTFKSTRTQQPETQLQTVRATADSMADAVARTVEDLARITSCLTEKVRTDPKTYVAAAQALVRNFDAISSDQLISALHSFGK